MLKVIHLNYSDISGGAAIAASRLHLALLSQGVNSQYGVNRKFGSLPNTFNLSSPIVQLYESYKHLLVAPLRRSYELAFRSDGLISFSCLPGFWLHYLNNSDVDIVHLHWIQGEMMSVEQLTLINKPIVWTFHDMWPFTGLSHYSRSNKYYGTSSLSSFNSVKSSFSSSVDNFFWLRKYKAFRKHPSINVVTPSHWLTQCASKSYIFASRKVSTIHNPIDTTYWTQITPASSRKDLGIPLDRLIILFGSSHSLNDWRKGFNILVQMLYKVQDLMDVHRLHLVTFGDSTDLSAFLPSEIPFTSFGPVHDADVLRKLYSASDFLVLPSRMDNLPNIAVEAHSCSLPILAFDIGGLPDIVSHLETGYLASPFDLSDFVQGFLHLTNRRVLARYSSSARTRSLSLFNSHLISSNYIDLYSSILQS